MKKKAKRTRRKRNEKVLQTAVKARQRSRQTQKMVIVASTALVMLAISGVGLHWAAGKVSQKVFYTNPDFALEKIEVRNPGRLNRNEILFWAGVKKGQNLFGLNLEQVRLRLEEMPYIASVQVERRLPSSLTITINERMPAARLMPYSTRGNLLAQTVYYIDSGGFVMKPKEGERLRPLPLITGISVDEIRENEYVDREEILSALNLIRAAGYYGLGRELDLRQLEIQQRGIISVWTRNRGVIRFRSDNLDQQIKRLQVILDYCQKHHKLIKTVDLTPSRNVPVRFL